MFLFYKLILIIILATTIEANTRKDALYKINKVRKDSGLNKLLENSYLWKSAKNHGIYLYSNNEVGHYQVTNNKFTGEKPYNRANYVGYPHKMVIENLTQGIESYKTSVDLLMTAIYHRFAFLNFNINEIGIQKTKNVIVYNMGNNYVSKACNEGGRDYKVNFCNGGDKISQTNFNNLLKIEKTNPKYIVYPSAKTKGVLPSFYDETPDPIPDKTVTGNPISISFNPSKVNKVNIKSFKLFDKGIEIKNTRLLSNKNDPHKKLTKYEYALFPLEPLKWGRVYEAEIKGSLDGKVFYKKWKFFTKRLKGRIYKINKIQNFSLKKNIHTYLTFDAKYFGRLKRFSTNCKNIKFIDYNTLHFNVNRNCILKLDKGDIYIDVL